MFDGENGAGGSAESTATEQTVEQQLEALFKGEEKQESTPAQGSEPPKEPKPEGDKEPPADASQSDGSEDLLKKLDDIKDEEKPEEEQKPQLSAEQQKILDRVPDAQTAEALVQIAHNYKGFNDALANRDFETVQKMIDPQAFSDFEEYIYAKKVATGEWVDRFIAENESPNNKGLQQLQKQISNLEKQIKDRGNNEQNAQLKAQQDRVVQSYVDHIEGLFNQINFSEADRPWIRDAINARVQNNPQVRNAILNGNVAAVNAVFKAAVRAYVERDKTVSGKKAEQLKTQEQKKPPMQSTEIRNEGMLPDDIKQVPKGQEDNWLDQQLNRLFASKRK